MNIALLENFYKKINNYISILPSITLFLFGLLQFLGYLYNFKYQNSVQSAYTFSAISLTQALNGFCTSFLIYSVPKEGFSKSKILLLDYLLPLFVILLLIFKPLIGLMAGSIYLGSITGIIVLNQKKLLIFPNQITLSIASITQLFFGNIFTSMLPLRLGLIICILRIMFNYKVVPVRVTQIYQIFRNLCPKISILSAYISAACTVTPVLPILFFGTGSLAQGFAIGFRASFLLENILNSRIRFEGDIKSSLKSYSLSIKLLIFLLFFLCLCASQFIILYLKPDLYSSVFQVNKNSLLFNVSLPLVIFSLLVSSIMRFFSTRCFYAYNFLRFNENANKFSYSLLFKITGLILGLIFLILVFKNTINPFLIVPFLMVFIYFASRYISKKK